MSMKVLLVGVALVCFLMAVNPPIWVTLLVSLAAGYLCNE